MVSFQNLSVKITASTQSFERGLEAAKDKTRSLGVSLRLLESRADETGDELVETGAKATGASGGLVSFGASATGASFGIRSLTTSLTVGLIPAVTALGFALTPLIPALVGLAAIGGSIAGVGLVGALGAIATNGDELKTVFNSVVGVLQDAFAPALQLATDTLRFLLVDFQNVIPELVPAQDRLQDLAGSFASLGMEIIDMLPAVVDLAVSLSNEFLPAVVDLAGTVLPKLPGLIRDSVAEFRRLSPLFMGVGRTIVRVTPSLLEFGRTALDVVAPAIGTVVDGVERGFQAFNDLNPSLQQTGIRVAALAGPLTSIATLIGGGAGVGVVGAVIGLAAAWKDNFAGIRTIVTRTASVVGRVLGNRLPTLISELKQLWQSLRPIIEPVVNYLLQVLSVGIVSALDGVLAGVTALVQVLNGDFTGAWDTVTGAVDRFIKRFARFLNSLSGGAFESLVNTFIGGLNEIGVAADQFLSGVGLGGQFDFSEIQQVELGTQPFQQPQSQPRSGGGERSPQEIRVVGKLREENGEITAKIDERVQQGKRSDRREFRRDRGRTPRGG